jgi:transglutaminase-like putative cysteine protease
MSWQTCIASRIDIRPTPAVTSEHLDFFGNRVFYFAVQDIHQSLEVTAVSDITVAPRAFSETSASVAWENAYWMLREDSDPEVREARQFFLDSPFVHCTSGLRDYTRDSFPAGRPLLEAAMDLNRRIHRDFIYDPHFTTLATPLEEVMKSRRGVCQDFAHLAIACLRSLGLAARYVSGYLETLPPPGRPKLVGADASHAWFAVYLPGEGWAELDPTNDCMPGERHITLAWGRDYGDVAPLNGVMSGGGSHTLKVSVDVVAQKS